MPKMIGQGCKRRALLLTLLRGCVVSRGLGPGSQHSQALKWGLKEFGARSYILLLVPALPENALEPWAWPIALENLVLFPHLYREGGPSDSLPPPGPYQD